MTKKNEIILYIIFGILTTLINIISYALFTRVIMLDTYISNIMAWILSVLFAYLTNRKYVFKIDNYNISKKIKELFSFYGLRIASLIIDMFIMYILINLINIDDLISKIITNIFVIVVNYLFSKYLIFNK